MVNPIIDVGCMVFFEFGNVFRFNEQRAYRRQPTSHNSLAVARSYIVRGWNPVLVKPSAGNGWQNIVITEITAPKYFKGELQNVGVQMGRHPHGLTDNCAEAIAVASYCC